MKVKPHKFKDNKTIEIIAETDFDAYYLKEFIGNGGPLHNWDFLKEVNRKVELKIDGFGQNVTSISFFIKNK